MTMDLSLTGRVAVVAASTGGLGRGVAQALAELGAGVVVCGRRGDIAREIAATLPHAVGIEVDLTREGSAEHLLEQARTLLGDIDILVLNSGGPPPGTAADLTPDAVVTAMAAMVNRQIELVSGALPGMTERGWGRIVAIGSSGVQQPLAQLALSNVARAGLAAYLKTLANEVARHGITVNMVLPGRIDTERVRFLDSSKAEREGTDAASVKAASEAGIPAGRYGTVAEFASVAAFLCSPAAGYVTGEQIRCDGGLVRSY